MACAQRRRPKRLTAQRGSAFRIGPTTLELLGVADPIPPAEIEYAASQSWEWPDASTAVSAHQAHILVTTRATIDVPRADIVRLHRRAHAALAEFAPVLGMMWRDAGRLIAPSASHNETSGASPRDLAYHPLRHFQDVPSKRSETGPVCL